MPAVQGFGVQPAGIDEDVEPLVGGELRAFLDVFLEVDDADLERGEGGDLEGTDFFAVDFGLVVGDINGAPHAAGEEHGVLIDDAFRDIDKGSR